MKAVKLLVETPGRKDGAEYLYEVGEVIYLEDGLADFWIANGRAEILAEEKPEIPPAPILDFEGMTVTELRELAKEKGISYSGLKKADLISELEISYVG